jgi:hypothetical protein
MSFQQESSVFDDVRRMKDEVFLLRKKQVVLVEGKSDRFFWMDVLQRVIPDQFQLYAWVNFPSPQTSGKLVLLAHYAQYGAKDFIICLDSDHDFLLGEPWTKQPFLFQTFAYSIENYYASPHCRLPISLPC